MLSSDSHFKDQVHSVHELKTPSHIWEEVTSNSQIRKTPEKRGIIQHYTNVV